MTTIGGSGSRQRCFRNGWNREDGFALIYFLVLIPALFLSWVLISDVVQAVTSADFDIKDTLDLGIRTANYQVNDRSQADGNAQVDAERAHAEFRNTLAVDLGLDPVTLVPAEQSPLAEPPRYILIVYNGEDTYAGCPAARQYSFDGSALVTTDLAAAGFPAYFRITESGVAPGAGGAATVRLEAPGCVAWMKAKARKALGKDEIESTRWMASEIHYW